MTDTEQARAKPLGEPIDADGEKLDVVPALDVAYLISGVGREWADFFVKGVEPLLANPIKLALGNNVAALPVIPPVDRDKDTAGVKSSHGLRRMVRLACQAKPQHIHGRAELLHGEQRF